MLDLKCLQEPYTKEFETRIKSIEQNFIELEETYFYPEGGGQPTDSGKLTKQGKEYIITHVEKNSGQIKHYLENIEGLSVGDNVICSIDWAKRFNHMRYHTATHVLSKVIFNHTGATVTGSQIYEHKARADFNVESFDKAKLIEMEAQANELLSQCKVTTSEFKERGEAFKDPDVIRTSENIVPEWVKSVRIITVPGIDAQACGGTHVSNTCEVGVIKITKVDNKGKGHRRLYFELIN